MTCARIRKWNRGVVVKKRRVEMDGGKRKGSDGRRMIEGGGERERG
jgi:hypothetical protein